jgi:methylglyoxal synthase
MASFLFGLVPACDMMFVLHQPFNGLFQPNNMETTRKLNVKKRIALVAHDNIKKELLEWATHNRDLLAKHDLVATGTTGKILEEKLNLPVRKLFSGPLGGDQQLGAMIAEGKLDFIVFFWDPMQPQPHDSDVKALLRIAVAWNILVACNRTTADFILTSSLMNDDYELKLRDHSSYLQRVV